MADPRAMLGRAERAERRPLRSRFADNPEMAELIDEFLAELPARVEALRDACRAREARMVRRLAHEIRGVAAGYGFPALGEAAAAVEEGLSLGDAARVEALRREVEALVELCQRACQDRS